MKNVKLTLATTLSVLALTFAGAASADSGNRFNNHKQNDVSKTTIIKHVNTKSVSKNARKINTKTAYSTKNSYSANNKYNAKKNTKKAFVNNRTVTKKIVKKNNGQKVIITKSIVKKPAKNQYVSKSRFNTKAIVTRNVKSNNKKVTKRVTKRNNKRFSYTVRSGDTLTRISLRTGVSVKALAKLNRLSRWSLNNISIGQVLRIS